MPNHIGPLRWKRSEQCVSEHHCAEVAVAGGSVLLRNSTRPDVVLAFSEDQWRAFIRMVRSEERPG